MMRNQKKRLVISSTDEPIIIMMTKQLLISVFSIFILGNCIAQQANTAKHDLFLKGVYLEDRQITLSWDSSLSTIEKYANPKIIEASRRGTELKWDSARILNGTMISLSCYINSRLFSKGTEQKLTVVYGSIDSNDIRELKIFFENYSHVPGKLTGSAENQHYDWVIDKCSVRLGMGSRYGSYLWIQKR